MPEVTKAGSDQAQTSGLLRRPANPGAISRLLNEWMDGDEQEQRETFQFLRQAMDEGRPAGSKLFP